MRQVPAVTKPHKITFLTSIGAGLEYYDCVIYYLLASFISQQFFPSSNHTAALFATFSIFAATNIIRPIGGTIFGMFGDRYGRKNVFANTLLLMAAATFGIGLVPPYAILGIVSTILFCLLLITQSVAFGAELPGALTFLLEHTHSKNRGLHCGFMIAAVGLGVTLGSFVTYIITKLLSNKEMLEFGFRLPFFLGGILAIVGFFIRRRTAETPSFLALKKPEKNALAELVKHYPLETLQCILLILFPACLITFFLGLPVYLHDYYNYKTSDIFLVLTCGYLWSALLLPLFGWVADKTNRKIMFFLALLCVLIFAPTIFALLSLKTKPALFCFVGIMQTLIAAMAANYFVLLPEVFPTKIRYTGTAFSYNITYSIAALMPLTANYVYQVVKNPNLLSVIFVALASISAVCLLSLKKTHNQNI